MTTWKCSRCRRPYRGRGDWNITVEDGVVVGALCPRCQTVDENTEAVINEATTDYLGAGPDGRLRGRPKS
ncbi:hypothetical protein LY13_003857 [Prauserella aidingensis]|uniref:hypothetical protein n=1 Tax=Prauserella aidingensis TaxID=387890 RepID=UPI0020A3B47C|nr:hypothetical protein [Prauserella aidingensis]MCP2255083.1 hypothetical protein [Prauserella aidingensis]